MTLVVQVLLLAVEGLTASLLGRVATPALDALVAKVGRDRMETGRVLN